MVSCALTEKAILMQNLAHYSMDDNVVDLLACVCPLIQACVQWCG